VQGYSPDGEPELSPGSSPSKEEEVQGRQPMTGFQGCHLIIPNLQRGIVYTVG